MHRSPPLHMALRRIRRGDQSLGPNADLVAALRAQVNRFPALKNEFAPVALQRVLNESVLDEEGLSALLTVTTFLESLQAAAEKY